MATVAADPSRVPLLEAAVSPEYVTGARALRDGIARHQKTVAENGAPGTERHMQRVEELFSRFGAMIGLSDEDMQLGREAAALHDIGQREGRTAEIITSPSKPTLPEVIAIQRHPIVGYLDIEADRSLGESDHDRGLLGFLVLNHHAHYRADEHRQHPNELYANYPRPQAVNRLAASEGTILTLPMVMSARLRRIGRMIAYCDGIDARIDPARNYRQGQKPLTAEEIANQVMEEVLLPAGATKQQVLELAEIAVKNVKNSQNEQTATSTKLRAVEQGSGGTVVSLDERREARRTADRVRAGRPDLRA